MDFLVSGCFSLVFDIYFVLENLVIWVRILYFNCTYCAKNPEAISYN